MPAQLPDLEIAPREIHGWGLGHQTAAISAGFVPCSPVCHAMLYETRQTAFYPDGLDGQESFFS
jgi:hypothetical protein